MRLRITYPLVLAAVLFGLVAGLAAQRTESAQALLRAAIDAETIDGNFSGAIKQYQVIAERFARTDRGATVTALLRMAGCYEKLGDPKARGVYESIVRDFKDRAEEARQAQARLGSTAASSQNELTTTRVRQGSLYRLSPDGRFYLGHRDGDAHLIELSTGNARQLTFQPEADSQVWEHAFSPAGDRVAYAWYTEKDNRVRLRLVATAGTSKAPPRTLVDNPEISEILPYDWSRDGRWIAVKVKRVDKVAQIGLVNPDTGSLSVLQTVDWNGVGGLRFSPDSRWLAFHRPERDGSFERDVVAITLDTFRLVPAATTQADETVVEWADGQRLLVASDRGGSVGIWAVPFHQGVPDSRLELVRPDVGYIRSVALSGSGALFYTQLRGSADIYTAPFDTATGRLTSAPTQPIQRYSGFNWLPEWSSDGKYLAYVSQRDVNNVGRHVVVIHSIDSGTTAREVRPTLSYLGFPRWSPDGRQFVARGADLKGRSGIVQFDAVTGAASLVAPNETCSNLPVWAPSSRSVFCYNQNEKAIREVDIETGKVLRSYPGTGLPSGLSPDGRYLVDANLKVVTLATGETREIFRQTPDSMSGSVAAIAWTPDGRNVAFAGIIRGAAGIWLVSIDGGEPRKILDVPVDSRDERGITLAVSKLGFNSKTGHLAYSLGAMPARDVWKMEHFLPKNTPSSGGSGARRQ